MSVKEHSHVRLYELPHFLDPVPGLMKPNIGALGCFHLGKLVALEGTVVRAGPVKMYQSQRLYECNKCKTR